MPEVEDLAQPRLLLVAAHHVAFDLHAAVHDSGDFGGAEVGLARRVEEFGVADHACLDDLAEAVGQLLFRQRRQRFRVVEHEIGLVEGSDQVFACLEVDGRLAAHR